MNSSIRRFYDPLYSRTELTQFEYALIETPEFQRLRYIRMCNINSMLITGASEISRFEHSLGVLRLAQEWINSHKSTVTESTKRALLAAAILHDMQTGPFGHSLQYILEDNSVEGDFTHNDIEHGTQRTYYQDLTAKAAFAGKPFRAKELLGDLWKEVEQLVKGEGRYGPLISGTMDLDNIDNVVRLAYHVGTANKEDADVALSLARDIEPGSNGLILSAALVSKLEQWQRIRHDLYKLLLLDWAEFSAKAMLTLAMEHAVDKELIGSDSWVMTDDELLAHLEKEGLGEAQDVAELVRRLRSGDLYHPICLLRSPSVNRYNDLSASETKRKLEATLYSHLRKEIKYRGKLLVHYILDWGKTDRSVDVTIRETGEELSIGEHSKSLLIGIFSSSPPPNKQAQDLLEAKFYDLLNESGVKHLTPIEDPLQNFEAATTTDQIQLL